MDLLVAHRRDGDDGHIEGIEERIAFDPAEPDRSDVQRQPDGNSNDRDAVEDPPAHGGYQYREKAR